jgi:hypothetical protein
MECDQHAQHAIKTHDARAKAVFLGFLNNYLNKKSTMFYFCTECLSGSRVSPERSVKMRALGSHLYLLSSIFLSTAHSHRLSPVENELRDLVTQNSVIRCGGMASVIKGFRDGTIAIVEWPYLIEAALELERASDELLWYMHTVGWLDTQTSKDKYPFFCY